jgi:hypothetical protein
MLADTRGRASINAASVQYELRNNDSSRSSREFSANIDRALDCTSSILLQGENLGVTLPDLEPIA